MNGHAVGQLALVLPWASPPTAHHQKAAGPLPQCRRRACDLPKHVALVDKQGIRVWVCMWVGVG